MKEGLKTGLSDQQKITQKKPAMETDKGQRCKAENGKAAAAGKPGSFTIKQ